MKHSIRNEYLCATVDSLGAELVSMVGINSGFEYIWQGDPKYWSSHAPILFPICGRLTEGRYTWQGRSYEMQLHGFARKSEFSLVESTPTSLVFELRPDEKIKSCYPFDFILNVSYILDGESLINKVSVQNTGTSVLPVSFGGHYGINVPLCDGIPFDKHRIGFESPKDTSRMLLSESLFMSEKTEPYALDNNSFGLYHEMFDNDAIILKNTGHTAYLYSPETKRAVKVDYPDIPVIAFWHACHSDAPYVCFEPWDGLPSFDGTIDDFSKKIGMTQIPGGESYNRAITITVIND